MISVVDAHACGEPGRVIVGGVLDVPGGSMFEKMRYLAQNQDGLRQRMLREPRGYPATCCNLILPPTLAEADAGFVIMEQTEYPPMSGSNTICVVTVLIETGMVAVVEPVTELKLETPAGLIEVRAEVADGKVRNVTFENVPAFATSARTSMRPARRWSRCWRRRGSGLPTRRGRAVCVSSVRGPLRGSWSPDHSCNNSFVILRAPVPPL